MSLALFASPIDGNNDIYGTGSVNESAINKKRNAHTRTQKRLPLTSNDYDSSKVNTVLQNIHHSTNEDSEHLGDFNPPPFPNSMGVENTKVRERFTMLNNLSNKRDPSDSDVAPIDNSNLSLNSINNHMDGEQVKEYFKNLIPNYSGFSNPPSSYNSKNDVLNMMEQLHSGYQHTPSSSIGGSSNSDVLLEKINYMINLLEEQQDERTGNVTEEVVLYSFLGIFIIFITDSFARIGKYVR